MEDATRWESGVAQSESPSPRSCAPLESRWRLCAQGSGWFPGFGNGDSHCGTALARPRLRLPVPLLLQRSYQGRLFLRG
jgi:hypothetical protein